MMKLISPQKTLPKKCKTAREALDAVEGLYRSHTEFLRKQFDSFSKGKMPDHRVRACYPYVRLVTKTATKVDTRLSYGFVPGPGTYETTLTRPDIYKEYYKNHFDLLINNHGEALEIGVLNWKLLDLFHCRGNNYIFSVRSGR